MFRNKNKDGTTVLTGGGPLAAYPVGAVYMAMNATSPATLFGGSWARLAQGRVLVGLNESDSSFSSVRETGGEKSHALTVNELATHQHTISHDHDTMSNTGTGNGTNVSSVFTQNGTTGAVTTNYLTGPSDPSYSGTEGSGIAHNNLQPYLVCYMWERTA